MSSAGMSLFNEWTTLSVNNYSYMSSNECKKFKHCIEKTTIITNFSSKYRRILTVDVFNWKLSIRGFDTLKQYNLIIKCCVLSEYKSKQNVFNVKFSLLL